MSQCTHEVVQNVVEQVVGSGEPRRCGIGDRPCIQWILEVTLGQSEIAWPRPRHAIRDSERANIQIVESGGHRDRLERGSIHASHSIRQVGSEVGKGARLTSYGSNDAIHGGNELGRIQDGPLTFLQAVDFIVSIRSEKRIITHLLFRSLLLLVLLPLAQNF